MGKENAAGTTRWLWVICLPMAEHHGGEPTARVRGSCGRATYGWAASLSSRPWHSAECTCLRRTRIQPTIVIGPMSKLPFENRRTVVILTEVRRTVFGLCPSYSFLCSQGLRRGHVSQQYRCFTALDQRIYKGHSLPRQSKYIHALSVHAKLISLAGQCIHFGRRVEQLGRYSRNARQLEGDLGRARSTASHSYP
jgi:hypothetical protein